MISERSLQSSQKSAFGPHPEIYESSPHPHTNFFRDTF